MKTEKRATTGPAELRQEGDEPPTITGYAAKFYRSDDPGTEYQLWKNTRERIMPNAFDEAVKSADVRALYNHDPNMLLGRTKSGTLALSVDKVGLRYEITPSNTSVYRDVVENLRRGDLDGSSFQFSIKEGGETWKREGTQEIRELTNLDLIDVSVVAFPAYQSATAGVRSVEDCDTAKRSHEEWTRADNEKALREQTIRDITIRGLDV